MYYYDMDSNSVSSSGGDPASNESVDMTEPGSGDASAVSAPSTDTTDADSRNE